MDQALTYESQSTRVLSLFCYTVKSYLEILHLGLYVLLGWSFLTSSADGQEVREGMSDCPRAQAVATARWEETETWPARVV